MNKIIQISKKIINKKKEYIVVLAFLFILNFMFFPKTYFKQELISTADFLYEHEPWAHLKNENFKAGNRLVTDPLRIIYPAREVFLKNIDKGEFALWNNKAGLGSPQGAFFTSIFNPFLAFFLLFFSHKVAITLNILMYPLISGFSTYLLLRKYKLSKSGALLGSVVTSFSLFNIVWLTTTLAPVSALIPAVLWSIERFFKDQSPLNGILFLIFYSFLIISGFLSTTVYASILFGIYILFFSVLKYKGNRNLKKLLKRIFSFLFLGITSIFLVAFTLVPTLDYLDNKVDLSYRKRTHSERSIPKDHLIRLVIPEYYGNPAEHSWKNLPNNTKENNQRKSNFNEGAMYIGILPLLLALISTVKIRENKKVFFYLVVSIFSLLLIFNIGPLLEIISNLPIFNSNPSTRLTILLSFSLSVLSAFGLDLILEKFRQLRNRDIGKLVLVAIILIITFIDLHNLGYNYNPTIKTKDFFPSTKAIKYVQKNNNDYSRILPYDDIMLYSISSYYNLNSLNLVNHYDKRWVNFINYIQPNSITLQRKTVKFRRTRTDMKNQFLDLVGTKYILNHRRSLPISNKPLINFERVNSELKLTQEEIISQDFLLRTPSKIDGIAIRVRNAEILDPTSLQVVIQSKKDKLVRLQDKIQGQQLKNKYLIVNKFKLGRFFPKGKYNLSIKWSKKTNNHILFQSRKKETKPSGIKQKVSFTIYKIIPNLMEKYRLIYNQEIKIYENRDSFNRTFLTHNIVEATSQNDAFQKLTKLEEKKSLNNTSVIEKPSEGITLQQCDNSEADHANIIEYNANDVTIEASSKCDSILTLSDIYDPEWQVFVDGQEKEVLKTDYLLRGVYLPPGKHQVVFKYKPKAFYIGTYISSLTLVSIITILTIIIIKKARE